MHLGRPARAARAISSHYVFSSLFVPDEQKLLQGIGQVISMDEEGIVIELPEDMHRGSIPQGRAQPLHGNSGSTP
jgi:hypothetical protein